MNTNKFNTYTPEKGLDSMDTEPTIPSQETTIELLNDFLQHHGFELLAGEQPTEVSAMKDGKIFTFRLRLSVTDGLITGKVPDGPSYELQEADSTYTGWYVQAVFKDQDSETELGSAEYKFPEDEQGLLMSITPYQ